MHCTYNFCGIVIYWKESTQHWGNSKIPSGVVPFGKREDMGQVPKSRFANAGPMKNTNINE